MHMLPYASVQFIAQMMTLSWSPDSLVTQAPAEVDASDLMAASSCLAHRHAQLQMHSCDRGYSTGSCLMMAVACR